MVVVRIEAKGMKLNFQMLKNKALFLVFIELLIGFYLLTKLIMLQPFFATEILVFFLLAYLPLILGLPLCVKHRKEYTMHVVLLQFLVVLLLLLMFWFLF